MLQARIDSLPKNPAGAAVYVRPNGQTYLRLNERYHVKVKPMMENGSWVGDGSSEEINPNEVVEVIHPAHMR
jgi:hypothetical protein